MDKASDFEAEGSSLVVVVTAILLILYISILLNLHDSSLQLNITSVISKCFAVNLLKINLVSWSNVCSELITFYQDIDYVILILKSVWVCEFESVKDSNNIYCIWKTLRSHLVILSGRVT